MTDNIINHDEIKHQYEDMRAKFKAGDISKDDWLDYCMGLFDEVLIQNQDVMIRLKNRCNPH